MAARGQYVRFSTTLDVAANRAVHRLRRRLLAGGVQGIRDLYPSYGTLYVEWDDALVGDLDVERWLDDAIARGDDDDDRPIGRDVELPISFDGVDLPDVAAALGLDTAAVISALTEPIYHLFAIGAAPGQPFLGPNAQTLTIARRTDPRIAVEPHSLAIAGRQTTVYPVLMPGGWHVVGTALEPVYDPHRAEPFLFAAEDRARLVAATGPMPSAIAPLDLLPGAPRLPALKVDQAGTLDLLVDGGRLNAAHLGMAQTGPLDRAAARLANALVGNPWDAPLIETTLIGPSLTALRTIVIAVAGAGAALEVDGEPVGSETVALRAGDRIRVRPTGDGVRGYLAIAGGIESEAFLGSVSVDRRGLVGRSLRDGDVLGVAREVATGARLSAVQLRPDDARPIRLVPGPQYSRAAGEALVAGAFSVATGDRMGVRLDGPEVPGGELLSESPPLGAVQITTGGTPIILLNDRQRVAGYDKPAVVVAADLPRIGQLRPGQPVRFVFADGPAPIWYRDVDA